MDKQIAKNESAMVDLLNQEMKELQESQKQIEEMAKDLQEAWTAWSLSKDLKNPYAFVAEILAKKWQPKTPEGAVVLTRRAYDGKEIIVEMSGGHKLRLTVGKFGEMCKILEEHTRKETAEKFAERVKMAFYYEFDELIPSIMADKIDEIAKEITEGEV